MTAFLDTPVEPSVVDPLSVSIPPPPLCDETTVTAAHVRDDEDSDDDAVVFVDAIAAVDANRDGAVTPPATTMMESPPLTGPVKNLALFGSSVSPAVPPPPHIPRGVSAAAAASATPPIQGEKRENRHLGN